jgi:hypothetical protein
MIFAVLLVVGLAIGKFKGGGADAGKGAQPHSRGPQPELRRPLCVYEGPFPKVGREVCLHCSTLRDAGLVERVSLRQPDGSELQGHDLTAEGMALYDPAAPTANGKTAPGLCFGKARVAEVIETLPPMRIGSVTHISARFTLQIFDRTPFVHSPNIALLKQYPYLPWPKARGDQAHHHHPQLCRERRVPRGRSRLPLRQVG